MVPVKDDLAGRYAGDGKGIAQPVRGVQHRESLVVSARQSPVVAVPCPLEEFGEGFRLDSFPLDLNGYGVVVRCFPLPWQGFRKTASDDNSII